MARKKKAEQKADPHVSVSPVAEPTNGPVNVITDRKGTVFNPEVHAATADGTPHVDSAGSFILKAHHYDGAKKAHFADSFRHA